MFESLSQKLNTIFNKISSKGRISERDIEETLKARFARSRCEF